MEGSYKTRRHTTKSFSVNKYGYEDARMRAIEAKANSQNITIGDEESLYFDVSNQSWNIQFIAPRPKSWQSIPNDYPTKLHIPDDYPTALQKPAQAIGFN